jgi:hypothetical protein
MNEQDDDHDEDEIKRFDIDAISDDLDWQPPPAIADLIEQNHVVPKIVANHRVTRFIKRGAFKISRSH